MISWYIDSTRTDDKYLAKVKQTVEPCMDYFCDRLYEIEDFDLNDINKLFKEIIEELPILNFVLNPITNEIYFQYSSSLNANTKIRFHDATKGIRRELILNKILG